jgi:geranylgeranyl diphosphate synthase type II
MLANIGVDQGHIGDLSQVDALMAGLLTRHHGLASSAALEHLSCRGKQFRASLALQSALSLGLGMEAAVAIAAASELLHNASLVHDDIQDGSRLRRGRATLWASYGTDVAICAGDLMISASYASIAKAGGQHMADAMDRMHQRVSQVICGQVADLSARDTTTTTFFQYRSIAVAKSAPLFGLPLELSLTIAGRADYIGQAELAAQAFALGYQMTDDIDDVVSDMANGQLNAVAIFSRDMPLERASILVKRLAARSFRQAERLALSLPSQSGELMASIASDRAWLV